MVIRTLELVSTPLRVERSGQGRDLRKPLAQFFHVLVNRILKFIGNRPDSCRIFGIQQLSTKLANLAFESGGHFSCLGRSIPPRLNVTLP